MADSPPSGPSSLTYPYSLNFQSSTSVAIIIVVLGATFFFMFLFVIYIKRCNISQRIDGDGATGGWNRQQMIHGLDPEILKKFPIMKFSSLVSVPKQRSSSVNSKSDVMECAVCLGAFEESELLRILPACGHLFHPECIDMWLETHSTCPLCRRSLSRDAVSGHLQRALAALTRNLNPESPDATTHVVNSDIEAAIEQPNNCSVSENNNNSSSNSSQILRALSRNSESFKMAAHNLEVQDVRDRLRASSSGRFNNGSPTQQRSLERNPAGSVDQLQAGLAMTPIACGPMEMHHSQSFRELLTRSNPPNSRGNADFMLGPSPTALCLDEEEVVAHSERLKSAARTMSLSSLRRSFSASSSSRL